MMEFKDYSKLIKKRFDDMTKQETLYRINVDRDAIWNLYLSSFPEGTNPIYRERTEHDCNCCKNFIRDVGDVVYIENGVLHTIWDVPAKDEYGVVTNALNEYVKSQLIKEPFQHFSPVSGAETTRQQLEDKSIKTWNHFHCVIPRKFVSTDGENLNAARTTVQVFERGLKEITDDSVDIVIDLINQGSIYRGNEHLSVLQEFKKLKVKYARTESESKKNWFLWENYKSFAARIRNTAIGTLLTDLSEGADLDHAVSSFEAKVAPSNYKRPKALVTKGMIEQAMKTINELGIEKSLYRAFAVAEQISVNNVLFADRNTASIMKDNLMDSLLKEVKNDKQYSKLEEVSIEDFITRVLPDISSMEVLLENKHVSNLVSLIAPKFDDAPNILKWNNKFSWSYNGNITDSTQERVKNAGGSIEAIIRTSLSWHNFDDLDLHIIEPNGHEIYYGARYNSKTGGNLDVDMNAGRGTTREPVENIVYQNSNKIAKGVYEVIVRNYAFRESDNKGFEIQTAWNGEINNYSYPKGLGNKEQIEVLRFAWDGEKVVDVKVGKGIISSSSSREMWGIKSQDFHRVNIMTISPNFWDGQEIGNKHYFFMLENCLNDEQPRGFYNEFLDSKFDKHRKVFELISSKTKCEISDRQLSGLGFSSTKRDSLVCKVQGSFNRTLKINF